MKRSGFSITLIFLIQLAITSPVRSQIKNVSELISLNNLSINTIKETLKKEGFKYWNGEKYLLSDKKTLYLKMWRYFDKDSIGSYFGIFFEKDDPVIFTYMTNNLKFLNSINYAANQYELEKYVDVDKATKFEKAFRNERYTIMVLGMTIEGHKNLVYYTCGVKHYKFLKSIFSEIYKKNID